MESLVEIDLENLKRWIREENGKRKNRVLVRAGSLIRAGYDLANADSVRLEKLRSLPVGIHPLVRFFDSKPSTSFPAISPREPSKACR